ncbi:MAG: AAA family ATPase, partial [Burkholderiaceae bacterium]
MPAEVRLSFYRQLSRRHRLILSWAVAVVVALAAAAAVSALQRSAVEQSRAYQTEMAREFGEQQQRWLLSPKDPSEFEAALQADRLSAVAVDGPMVLYTLRDGSRHSTRLVSGPQGLVTQLERLSVDRQFALTRVPIDARAPIDRYRDALAAVPDLMLRLVPVLLMGVLIVLVARQSGMLGRDGLHVVERPGTRFDDVIGATEAKQEFQHVVSFLKDPRRYAALGASAPRGVLLEGPPGTGKTLLARAVAGECGANFIAVDGASFSSMYYGLGIAKVRQLFATARRKAPCIVFIDEADGIGMRVSGEAAAGGVAEQNRIINRILVEMDGFDARDGVVVLAATNHVQNIDPALRRPGRFDRSVRLAMPVQAERRELFSHYLRGVPAAGDVDCAALSAMSQGMSPADIANVVNRAAAQAARDGSTVVMHEHLLAAIEEHQLGGAVSAVKALLRPATRERIARH